jgi:hypothetical protein
MDNPWKLISLVLFVLFVFSILLGFSGAYSLLAGSPVFAKNPQVATGAAQNAVGYINNNLLGEGETSRLLDVNEESGVYRISTEFSSKTGTKTIDAYMTKDGRILFPAFYKISGDQQTAVTRAPAAVAQTPRKITCADIRKQDPPVLQAFVVSKCPYGTQMQAVLLDIVTRIPGLSPNIRVRYIGDVSQGTVVSMHGPGEAAENLRQICIREEQADKYWSYVSCTLSSPSSGTCTKTAGIEDTALAGCISDKSRGTAYAQADFSLARSFGVAASPTLILNNATVRESDFGGRNPEAIKSLLCCGFTTQPESCNNSLAGSQVPAGSGQC